MTPIQNSLMLKWVIISTMRGFKMVRMTDGVAKTKTTTTLKRVKSNKSKIQLTSLRTPKSYQISTFLMTPK